MSEFIRKQLQGNETCRFAKGIGQRPTGAPEPSQDVMASVRNEVSIPNWISIVFLQQSQIERKRIMGLAAKLNRKAPEWKKAKRIARWAGAIDHA